MKDLHALAGQARAAAWELAACPIEKRNAALLAMAGNPAGGPGGEIFPAKGGSPAAAGGWAGRAAGEAPRLRGGEASRRAGRPPGAGRAAGSHRPDHLEPRADPGLNLYRVTCPIGVVGVIFESRPDALVQIASLCLKSGNAALLKGGREALGTNRALHAALSRALEEAGLPAGSLILLETREDVGAMLKEDALIDLIIPRGSNAFVRWIMDNSRIPVLGHSDGICHVYVDRHADI